MKKAVVCLLLLFAAAVSFSACNNAAPASGSESSAVSAAESENVTLITKEELIDICGLTEEEYADKDLDEFISKFSLTKDNVGKFNIHELLADDIEVRSVEYLFDGTAKKRETDFTSDVACIVFMENENTSVNTMYIDAEEKTKWAYENENVLWDLNQFGCKFITSEDIDNMLAEFEKMGVFSLEDKTDNYDDITDPMTFRFVIEYKDGSRFDVSRSGKPGAILPEFYADWHEMMFK